MLVDLGQMVVVGIAAVGLATLWLTIGWLIANLHGQMINNPSLTRWFGQAVVGIVAVAAFFATAVASARFLPSLINFPDDQSAIAIAAMVIQLFGLVTGSWMKLRRTDK